MPGRADTIPLMGEEILREFARFRRRHLWVRGLDLFLEAADRRIFAIDIVAHLGAGDGLTHRGRRPGDCIGTKVESALHSP